MRIRESRQDALGLPKAPAPAPVSRSSRAFSAILSPRNGLSCDGEWSSDWSSLPDSNLVTPLDLAYRVSCLRGKRRSGPRIRERLGISQRDLAALLGVSGAAVARWESGSLRVAPAHERLLRTLAQAPTRRVNDSRWVEQLAAGAAIGAFLWLMFGKEK